MNEPLLDIWDNIPPNEQARLIEEMGEEEAKRKVECEHHKAAQTNSAKSAALATSSRPRRK